MISISLQIYDIKDLSNGQKIHCISCKGSLHPCVEHTEDVPPRPCLPGGEDLLQVAAISVAVTHSDPCCPAQLPLRAAVKPNVF